MATKAHLRLHRLSSQLQHPIRPSAFALKREAELQAESASWNAPSDLSEIPVADYEEIPILDLAGFLRGDVGEREKLARQLKAVGEGIGFHFIVNHGIDTNVLGAALSSANEFFSRPAEEKNALKMDAGVGYLGPRNVKLPARKTPNHNEAFVIKQLPALGFRLGTTPWPTAVPSFRERVSTAAKALEKLSCSMLPLYARALGLPADYFAPAFRLPTYRLRLSKYPQTPKMGFGINPHKDTSFFTVLHTTDASGLVVFSTKRNAWVRLRNVPGALVVNGGQLLQQVTNDRFPATKHYAINNKGGSEDRFSLPFFFNATATHRMAVVPTCVSDADPAKYPPTSYLEGQGLAQGE